MLQIFGAPAALFRNRAKAVQAMIYEERTYTLRPGATPAFLSAYKAHGIAAHRRHLGEQVAFFTTDVGILNQVVQIFAFADAGDRQRRREALYADPEWEAFVPALAQHVQHMESRLLMPTEFSPLA
jgi:hypothetical protein